MPIEYFEISGKYICVRYRRIGLFIFKDKNYSVKDYAAVLSFVDKTEGISKNKMLYTALLPLAAYEKPLVVDIVALSDGETFQDRNEVALLREKIAEIGGISDKGFIGSHDKTMLHLILQAHSDD